MRFKKSISIILAVLFILLSTPNIRVSASGGDVVAFKDKNLENIIRQTINKPDGDILVSDLSGMVRLSAENQNISDLSGLEYASNLQYLYLDSNNITDLSPISSLTKLYQLHIENNKVSSLVPLTNLTNIYDLRASNNAINSLTPLSKLVNLNILLIGNNKITDITPVSKLSYLYTLSLDTNQIQSLPSLDNLISLENLDLQLNKISDLTPLSNLRKVKFLGLTGNTITDIRPISRLTTLSWLFLDSNNISDLKPLSNLTQLTFLGLGDNNIKDLSGLESLKNLIQLNISGNFVSSLQPLASLTGLKNLLATDNQITDSSLIYIKQLNKLNALTLDSNKITNLASLKQSPFTLPYLRGISLYGIYNGQAGSPTDIFPGLYDSRATAYESKLKHIINDIITPDMTDLEKALAIHDYLVDNTNYTLDSTAGSYDLIMKGVASCSTYTNAANDLFNLAGLPSQAIGGEGHAWNIVKIDGDYYHFDATWDDEGDSGFNYEYFLLSDDQIKGKRSGPMFNWDSPNIAKTMIKTVPCDSTKYTFLTSKLNEYRSSRRNQIAVKGSWIYYVDYNDSGRIHRVALDGTQDTTLNQRSSDDIQIKGNTLYYLSTSDSTYYRIGLDGSGDSIDTELRVTKEEPKNAYNRFPVDGTIKLTFNQAVALKDAGGISLKDSRGIQMDTAVSMDNNTLIIKPKHKLVGYEEYSLSIPAAAVVSASGSIFAKDYELDFSTAAGSVAAPTIDYDGDVYFKPIDVTLTVPSGTIYYTLDNSEPTTGSTKYTGKIHIGGNTVLRYFAVDSEGNASREFTQVYTVEDKDYGVRIASGDNVVKFAELWGNMIVDFDTASVNHAFYSTTDGTDPTAQSSRSTECSIFPGQKVKYMVADKAGNTSPIFEVSFKVADINNDNAVNITDLAEIASKYQTKNDGSQHFNSIDLNCDNTIDIYDLVKEARFLD